MREIKFRAWDKVKKKWMSCTEIEYGVSKEGIDELLIVGSLGKQNYDIVQFTGLLDKNGKEIYEEDILHRDFRKVPNSPNWLVMFDREKGRWVFKRDGKAFGGFGLTITSARDYKIIGNIYENPDLLNQKP